MRNPSAVSRLAHRRAARRGPTLTLASVAASLLIATSLAAAPSATAAACTTPVFVEGLAQNVFTATTTEWVRGEVWVQSEFDSDNDGQPDRIHAEYTIPPQAADPACNYDAPVIFEDSPYYAGTQATGYNWPVDHEIGAPPPERVRGPHPPSDTTPKISSSHEATWLPRGFAVVHAESPGSGWSDGCPTSGAPNESLAAKNVIDWLNGRAVAYSTRDGSTEVVADWTTGKVAMIGTSYNGTIPIGAATTGVEGLEAIVPISAISNWYDYYRANGMVRAPGGFQGEDLDVLEDYVYSRNDESPPRRMICEPVIAETQEKQDRATGDYNPFWDERNYMNDVDNVHAAVLIAHGNNDFNVMTKNMAQFYEAIRERGVPHQLYFHRGGHGGSPPNVMLNRWFTRYLFGVENGVEDLPKAWVVREADACPPRETTAVGDQANTAELTVADSSKLTLGFVATITYTNSSGAAATTTRTITSIPNPTTIVLQSAVATGAGEKVANGQPINHACNASNPSPYAEWPDPTNETATVNFSAGGSSTGGLTFRPGSEAIEMLIDEPHIPASQSANAQSSPARLLYKSPVLTEDVRINGTPWLDLHMSFSEAKANLTGVLLDYPASGNATILTRGWIDPENRGGDPSVSEPVTVGEFYRMRFDMQPKDSVIKAGRRIGIMILASDQEYTIRPLPGTELEMDLAQSRVELPVAGGTAALARAFGVTPPSISHTLDPATPAGQNGWYTGDVSLAWQVDDGGAEATTTGCADETFTSDGEFTRTCEASNVAGSTGPVSVTVKRDATPPVTTATVSPAPTNGWHSNPMVSLATDDGAGSGVASTEYRINGGPLTPYTGPFQVTGNGIRTIEFRSADHAGHLEAAKSIVVKNDVTKPTVSINSPIQGATYEGGSVLVADFHCEDSTSGVDSCTGTVADGQRIDTSTAGRQSFTVEGRDLAGNVRTRTVTYTVTPRTCPRMANRSGNHMVGTTGVDTLTGTAGVDVICGLGGDDVIKGAGGEDIVIGGRGDDRIHGGNDADRIRSGPGQDRSIGGAGTDFLAGGAGNDLLAGAAGDDRVVGDTGNDVLRGGGGDDYLGSRDDVGGNDRLNGGIGRNTCEPDDGDILLNCSAP